MKPPEGIVEIDGKRYHWRTVDCLCGWYEVEEKAQAQLEEAHGEFSQRNQSGFAKSM